MKTEATKEQAPGRRSPAPCSADFVYLNDFIRRPFRLRDGWVHRWEDGLRCWVTLRPIVEGEIERVFRYALPMEQAMMYEGGVPFLAERSNPGVLFCLPFEFRTDPKR